MSRTGKAISQVGGTQILTIDDGYMSLDTGNFDIAGGDGSAINLYNKAVIKGGSNGDMVLQRDKITVDGDLNVSSASGNISVSSASGDLDLEFGSGDFAMNSQRGTYSTSISGTDVTSTNSYSVVAQTTGVISADSSLLLTSPSGNVNISGTNINILGDINTISGDLNLYAESGSASRRIQMNNDIDLQDGYIYYDSGRRVDIMVNVLNAVPSSAGAVTFHASSGTLITSNDKFYIPVVLPRSCTIKEWHVKLNKGASNNTTFALYKREWGWVPTQSPQLVGTEVSTSTSGTITMSDTSIDEVVNSEDQTVFFFYSTSDVSANTWSGIKIVVELDKLSETSRG